MVIINGMGGSVKVGVRVRVRVSVEVITGDIC